MQSIHRRLGTLLLTAAVVAAAPTAAFADGHSGDAQGPGTGCPALQQLAGKHPGWTKAFPALAVGLASCQPTTSGTTAAGAGTAGSGQFTDLQNYGWASADISLLAQLGVIKGVGGDRFEPAGQLTRVQFAQLLQRLFALPEPTSPIAFVDVTPATPGYGAIEAAAPYMTQFNTLGGVAFEPQLPEVRIEVAATMGEIEIAEHLATLPGAAAAAQIWSQFSDGTQVPAGLSQTAAVAVELGLMKGYADGSFGIDDTLTRAQAAVLLARVLASDETIGTAGTPPPVTGSTGPTVSGLSPNTGPASGGTAVVLTGTGFVSGAQVLFGATPAESISYVSPTQIDAVSPAGSGSVNVIVTDSAGTSAMTAADLFTYAQAGPSVTSLSPTSGSTAGGTAVIVSGSGFLAGAEVLFGATAAESVNYVSSTQLDVVSPAGTGSVAVVVVEASGTSAATTSDLFTYASTPASSLAITGVSPDTGPTAGGTGVVISGVGFAAGAQVYFGGAAATGVTVYNGTTITAVSPAGAGTVSVSVTLGGVTATSPSAQFSYTCNGTVSSSTYCPAA